MGMAHLVNTLAVTRYWYLILLIKIDCFLLKNTQNSQDSKSTLIFSLALAVDELLAILRFFTKQKLQNMFGTLAATWQQKLAADRSKIKLLL